MCRILRWIHRWGIQNTLEWHFLQPGKSLQHWAAVCGPNLVLCWIVASGQGSPYRRCIEESQSAGALLSHRGTDLKPRQNSDACASFVYSKGNPGAFEWLQSVSSVKRFALAASARPSMHRLLQQATELVKCRFIGGSQGAKGPSGAAC